MLYRIILLSLAVGILFVSGCRTGEYNVDLEIYEAMPGLIEQFPEVTADLAHNEDGSLRIMFEQGEMHLWFRAGRDMDVVSRQEAASAAFEIFHAQYMSNDKNKKGESGLYREIIYLKGYLDEIELYVIEWDLTQPDPNVKSNREGNFY